MSDPGTQTGGDDQFQELRNALDELAELDQEAASMAQAAPAAAAANPIDQFCAIWPSARRVIEIVLRLPFIPGGVKAILRQLLTVGDAICPRS